MADDVPFLHGPSDRYNPIRRAMQDPRFRTLTIQERSELINELRSRLARNMASANTKEIPSIPPAAPANAVAGVGPSGTFTKPIMTEISRKAKLADQAEQIKRSGQELLNLYNAKIKPRIESGELGSLSQGWDYTYPRQGAWVGSKVDPDVQKFITKSGPFATLVNSYYSQQSGGKGGVQQYEVITEPHIPHPPTGAIELLGLNPKGQQWDLQKQGDQLPVILSQIELNERRRGVEDYGGAPNGASTLKSLDEKAKALGVDW